MQVLGSILRFLFAWIDGIVAKVITLVYNLLMDLANLTLYSENIVKVIGQRIGILLGIFMLFRLSVSLINYMISPERFSDNKQGGGALIKNIIISLVLLATVNTIFETAYSVQQKIVSSQIIEKIFFGETSQTKMDIGYFLYSGFFTPNTEVIPSCEKMWDTTKDLQRIPCDEYENGTCPSEVKTCDGQLRELLDDTAYKSVYDARNNLDMSQIFSNYEVVMANKGGAFKGQLLFNYTPIISTAAGVVTLLIMISFSMELAKRAIKLLFLQIVAPVPIIFNMDTGKGKDVFQKWYKQCFNTYISVFIRLLAIDFAVFIIVLLKGEFSNVFQDKLGVNIFIIIGCLLFAKEVPKLIEDMLGIKLDGMSLRPLKKFQDNALFGKQVAGVGIGAVAGTASGLSAAYSNMLAPGKGGRILGAGAGFSSAFSKSIVGGFKGEKFGKNFSNAYNTAMLNKQSREDRLDDDVSWGEMKKSHIQQKMGMHSTDDAAKSEKKHISKLQDAYKIIQSQSAAMDTTSFRVSAHNSAYGGTNSEILKFRTMNFAGIKELTKFKEQADSTKLQQRAGESDAAFIQRQKDHQDYLKYIEGTIDNRNNALAAGTTSTGDIATDRAIQDAFRTMKEEAAAFNSSIDAIDPKVGHITITDAKTINGTSKGAEARLSVSQVTQHAEKVQQYGAKKDQK